MNKPLRRVAIAVMALFALLMLNLNWVQFVKNDEYRNNPLNHRVVLSEYQRQRGYILVDRDAVALSRDTGGELRYQRFYPQGPVYAQITGYKSLVVGKAGIEAAQDSILSGDDAQLFVRRVSDMITGRQQLGGAVVLTVDRRAQETAYNDLNRLHAKGAVVALNPKTGAILAMVSTPSFDPNRLATHDRAKVQQAWNGYLNDKSNPLMNRAIGDTWPPGSTMKVIVSAAALEHGYQPDTMVPAGPSYTPPQTTVEIHNAVPSICPASRVSLKEALTVSCNTAYAQLGVRLGADVVRDKARDFGFEDNSLEIPMKVAPSQTGPMSDPPAVAQSAIGQRDVRETPLQNALVAAAVANGGREMKPYLIQEIQGPDFATLQTAHEEEWRQPISSGTASALRDMMVSVVENGTGTAARLDGYDVGGKTGTAEHGETTGEHGWFMGFAAKNGDPQVAIAVFLEGYGPDGSHEATRIAGDVMCAAMDGCRR